MEMDKGCSNLQMIRSGISAAFRAPAPLAAEVSFIEGQQGYVTLADEDVSTIVAFAEFIYTHKYVLEPDTSQRRNSGTPVDDHPSPGHGDYGKIFTQGKEYGNCGSITVLSGSMDTDYSQFLIAHAKIFIFADCYGVWGLLDQAMQKLHKALCGFRLSRESIGDIMALVRFCYERPCPEKLKRLVASYSAAIIDSGGQDIVDEGFRNLLKERGDFAADMAWIMACRLAGKPGF
ncbi:hypothetical protein E4U35_007352 [Claviceps purpurea]|nr:hypothetical protein E4U35_007352 [Claviceps purpurea]